MRASMHRLAALFIVLASTTAHADLFPRVLFQPADQPSGSGPPGATPPTTPQAVDDLASWAGPPRSTNLPELLKLAVQQAPALQSARIDISIADARIQQTWGRDDWQLNAQAVGSRSSGLIQGQDVEQAYQFNGDIDLARALPTGGTISFHGSSQYSDVEYDDATADEFLGGTTWVHTVSAQITQSLLRGRGRWLYDAPERIATISRDVAVLARRLAAIQTVQAVVAAYWDLILAEKQVAITQSSLELAKERLRITQIGNQGGKVPRSEIPAVQQIIATREEEVLAGELAVLDRSFTLRRAVGMPIGKGELGLRLGGDLATREASFDLGNLTERAFQASPELAQIAVQDKVAAIEIEVTENDLMPQLDASLSIGPQGQDGNFTTSVKNMALFKSISVQGALTFQHSFGQENVKGLAREQRETRRKLTVNAFDVKQQIAQTMARAVAQLELARRRVALSQRAIDLANENIKIETDRFNLGKSTNFDVLNRQEELRQAELRRVQAMIDWHKAESVVQALTGDILPSYGITVE
jgi:outer membrane protein TolC